MGRTVRDLPVPGRSPAELEKVVLAWLDQNEFTVLDPHTDGSEKRLPRWDGDFIFHPQPGQLLAIRSGSRGNTEIILEIGVRALAEGSTAHAEGYVTGRGIGWAGKEYDFVSTTLAVAGVPRKRGLELLGALERYLATLPVSPTPSTPPLRSSALPSLPSTSFSTPPPIPPSSAPAPTGPRPYRWTDRRMAGRPFPVGTSAEIVGVTASRLQSRLSEVLYGLGFEVVLDQPPRFDAKPAKPGPVDPHQGFVVGERNLRVDAGLRRRALGRGVAAAVAGAVCAAGALWGAAAAGSELGLLALPAGLLFGYAFTSVAAAGSFDSDIVWVLYAPRAPEPGAAAGPTVPGAFNLTIRAGSVTSQNWAGRAASGRNFKGLHPTGTDLATVPSQIAQALLRPAPP